MLLIIGVLITLATVAIISSAWIPGGVNAAQLGWVSEQWLAEYRASHPT